MPAPCFIAWNGSTGALATAPPAAQASGAVSGTAKTMLQLLSVIPMRVIEWGYSLDVRPAVNPRIELVDTSTVGATGLTALPAATNWNVPSGVSSAITLGTGSSGYAAGAVTEGTITATRLLDYQYEDGLYYKMPFPLGREPEIIAARYLRIRVTPGSAAAVNISCYIKWEE